MKKLFIALTTKSTALLSLASLVMTSKVTTAGQPVNPQPVKRTDAATTPVSAEGQKACVKHPKLGKYFCANAKQLSHLKKGAPEINATDVNNEKALLGVTDAESDAAVAMFGCDCVASVNCLRRLRNSLP
ncbi:MAG: hypothetical protein KME49_28555 [Brasilonema octagenarum HA4186-MV1]|jgi:hypothetical protein|uniref:Secreted protein n=2 Tax=Brasilonema TaxID=383614 RepID=A0A856MGR7_9CYAN|nr:MULTISPECIES: hypothetical protein [Brasilonema]MBW4629355.1 hypothetical protein [Brasilonema octagenarum HA4186-MV1]NMF67255.1 hypothetical protein [Brasilonema octagenarum UFV-OR1]QDL09898.1 hypothetical protein DP114_20215 [Brasilonema sennae CENA114]QDL16250.1 hypothetical protein DP113_20140 [Brasilonema octagenarum UFV-E1]